MIIFQSVSKHFGTEQYALRDISFEIEPGEIVMLTGPSGSGKTTIMRLLNREYTPTEGEIYLEEMPVHQLRSSQVHNLRRKIGVVFQDYRLLPELNVWENIALPLSIVGQSQAEIENRVTDLLKLVKLTDKSELFPRQLSGGEAQRISIARALAIGPQVIFADEPTGNLDPETSIAIARLLKKIQELGTTVIFATHDTGVLNLLSGERIIHLEQGELTIDTKPKSTKSKKSDSPDQYKKAESDESESSKDKPKDNKNKEVKKNGNDGSDSDGSGNRSESKKKQKEKDSESKSSEKSEKSEKKDKEKNKEENKK